MLSTTATATAVVATRTGTGFLYICELKENIQSEFFFLIKGPYQIKLKGLFYQMIIYSAEGGDNQPTTSKPDGPTVK